jgi:hypothetical protein
MDKLEERLALYNQGLNDTEIARRQGVGQTAVLYWRRKRGLPPKCLPGRRTGEPDLLPMRRLLFNLGWSAPRIAKYQDVDVETVVSWRKRNGVRANGTRSTARHRMPDANTEFRNLQNRVVIAIGRSLPPDIAADAASSLMLAVIEGEVPLDAIESRAKSFRSRALTAYANAFAYKSLDEDIPNRDGLRQIDMLVDEGSVDWLEKMGATVH